MGNDSRKYWEEKYKVAIENTKLAKEKYSSILIEVAAQHPLKDGMFPNEEFQSRLEKAIDLYNELSKSTKVYIFVPGSRHMDNGIADKISLSKAGENFLVNHGIPKNKIFGEHEMIKYKNEDGVYNSADECFVSAKLFFDNKFGKLICVCSPYQLLRKALFYVEFGVVASCYSVPTDDMYHSLVGEVFDCIPLVLNDDHNWQDKNKETFNISRKFRKPNN